MIKLKAREDRMLTWERRFARPVHEVEILVATGPDLVYHSIGRFGGRRHLLKDLPRGVFHRVAIAPIDEFGNPRPERDWLKQEFTPTGDHATVPPPTDFGVAQVGEWLEFRWSDPTESSAFFSHYELSWGSAATARVVIGETKETVFRWRWWAPIAHTFRLVAVSDNGTRSTEATASITVKGLQNFVAGNLQNESGGGFTGTKAGTEVSGGKLRYLRWGATGDGASDNGDDATWLAGGPAYGTYTCAQVDLTTSRLVRLEIEMAFETNGDIVADLYASDWVWPPRFPQELYGDEFDPYEEEGFEIGRCIASGDISPLRFDVEIQLDASGTWLPYVPGFYYCRYYQIRIKVWSWNRHHRPTIGTFKVQERQANLKEEGTETVIADPGPTVVTFANTYISAPTVVANSDTAGFFVQVVSITTTTATFRVYTHDGTEVFTGNIRWIAAGA